jgi:hypothetical protein
LEAVSITPQDELVLALVGIGAVLIVIAILLAD